MTTRIRKAIFFSNCRTVTIDRFILWFRKGGSSLCWVIALLDVGWIHLLLKLLAEHRGSVDVIGSGLFKENSDTYKMKTETLDN